MNLPEKIRSIPAWPCLAAASLAVVASAPAQYLGRQQDDLIYFIAARALTLGHYRLLGSPLNIPLTMANPGFPALLAPLILVFGANPGICQSFCVLILAGIPWLLWLWLKKRRGDWTAVLIALVFGLSPVVLSQAGTLMSEAPFLFFTLLLLISLEKPADEKRSGLWLLIITQIRSTGLAFLLGVLAEPIRAKNWKKILWLAAPTLAGFAAWSLWSWRAAGALQKTQELSVSYGGKFWTLWPTVAWANARYYANTWGSSYLPSAWSSPAGTILGAALGGLALAGVIRALRLKPTDAAAWILGGLVALHLIWPWHYDRYLIALLPLLLDAAASALGRRLAAPLLVLLLAGQALFQSPRWIKGTSWSHVELAQTYQWLRAHSAPQDVVSSALFVRDGFYARRPSLPLPDDADAEGLAREMRKYHVRFILWEDDLDLGLTQGERAAVRRTLEAAQKDLGDAAVFRLIYQNQSEHSRIYQVRP